MDSQALEPPLPPQVVTPVNLPVGVLDAFVDGARIVFRQPIALFVGGMIACLICGLLVALSFVPFALILTAPLLLLIGGPLATGLVALSLRIRAGQKIRAWEIWGVGKGTRKRLAGTILALVLISLLGMAIGISVLGWGMAQGTALSEMTPGVAIRMVGGASVAIFLGMLPWAFGGFAPGLVAERGLTALEAFRLSRQQTILRPIRSLTFTFACAALLVAGFLLGGVGLLFTAPWVAATRARMHEALFGLHHAPAGQPT